MVAREIMNCVLALVEPVIQAEITSVAMINQVSYTSLSFCSQIKELYI